MGVALTLGISTPPAARADGLDPEATRILQDMSNYLAQTPRFTVNADVDFEILNRSGQLLQFSSFQTLAVQRPNQFRVTRQGPVANAELIFDGTTLTLYGKNSNVYSQLAFESRTGIPAPGGDFLFVDPYAILSEGVNSSTYMGTAYVNGIECHHLAFREDDVDWQLWVQTGSTPLPMKYVIASKWVTSAPQYSVRLRDWNLNPQFTSGQFTFTPPVGAVKVEEVPASDVEDYLPPQGE
ncbi:MAG TPA: DUF2092 domain-containing protein [Leptolyngbyaceae cyanobacterium M65_K2018_010]|nr:DUF2092 domain-containing protein [Leptolyngbyaceae cyanobacterium M65_K2018_010]